MEEPQVQHLRAALDAPHARNNSPVRGLRDVQDLCSAASSKLVVKRDDALDELHDAAGKLVLAIRYFKPDFDFGVAGIDTDLRDHVKHVERELAAESRAKLELQGRFDELKAKYAALMVTPDPPGPAVAEPPAPVEPLDADAPAPKAKSKKPPVLKA